MKSERERALIVGYLDSIDRPEQGRKLVVSRTYDTHRASQVIVCVAQKEVLLLLLPAVENFHFWRGAMGRIRGFSALRFV